MYYPLSLGEWVDNRKPVVAYRSITGPSPGIFSFGWQIGYPNICRMSKPYMRQRAPRGRMRLKFQQVDCNTNTYVECVILFKRNKIKYYYNNRFQLLRLLLIFSAEL